MPAGGAPTGAGGFSTGGGGSGRSAGTSLPRITWFEWTDSKIDRIKVVTSDDGKAAALSPAEHIKHCLGIDEAVASNDVRPTLVYFHWPHEDPLAGKATEHLCTKVLDDETV